MDINTRVGNCKEDQCIKLEDLQIDSSKDENFHYVRESYKSLCQKEGYGDLDKLPKDQRISVFKKLSKIRRERYMEWKIKQAEEIGVCPNH